MNITNGHFLYLISQRKIIIFKPINIQKNMISISSQNKLSLSEQEIKINGMPTRNDLSMVYLEYPSNNLPFNQNSFISNSNNCSKILSRGINPIYNNLQNEVLSQYPSASTNISFAASPKIAPNILPRQAIQSTLFPCQQHKAKWTFEEDARLKDAVEKFGTDSWIRISQFVPGRNSKQCRERWMGQLAPTIRKDSWSREEDEILMRQHDIIGNKWTAIATLLPGRSAINVKNRWSKIKRIKDDFLIGGKTSSSSSTQNFNDQYYNNNLISSPDYEEIQTHKKNGNVHSKKASHKSSKFKHLKISNSLNRKQQKGMKSAEYTYNSDEIAMKEGNSHSQNSENFAVIKDKSSGLVFEFPAIENIPLFGHDFAQFQAQMLK